MAPSGSNPLGAVFHTVAAFSRRLLIAPDTAPDDHRLRPLLSLSLSPPPPPPPPPPPTPPPVLKQKDAKVAPLTKEEIGRATWMLLHTIAAQFPDEPTRQQKRDAKELETRHDFTIRKTRSLQDVRTDDYQPNNPSPSSKASIRPGPIEHGTPLLPYVPRYPPPPGQPKDARPAQSPVA